MAAATQVAIAANEYIPRVLRLDICMCIALKAHRVAATQARFEGQ